MTASRLQRKSAFAAPLPSRSNGRSSSQCDAHAGRGRKIARPEVERICARYRMELDRLHLTAADPAARAFRWTFTHLRRGPARRRCGKIAIALDRGRTNIDFLVILSVMGRPPPWRWSSAGGHVSATGCSGTCGGFFDRCGRAVDDPAGHDDERGYALAAVFGFGALPGLFNDVQASPMRARHWQRRQRRGSSGGGSGCGGGGGGGCGGCGSS